MSSKIRGRGQLQLLSDWHADRATCKTGWTVVSVFELVPYVNVCVVRNTEPPRRGAEQTRE